jgi:hypothetical protein
MVERVGYLRSNHGCIFVLDVNQISVTALPKRDKKKENPAPAQGNAVDDHAATSVSHARSVLAIVAVGISS